MHVDRSTVARWERGEAEPQPWQRPKLAALLAVSATELDGLLADESADPKRLVDGSEIGVLAGDDERDALELIRRVQASDVGSGTLDRLEQVFDELAMRYPVVAPGELLAEVRRYSGYVAELLGARSTLAQHRRLLVLGGWLSLLAATVHIDLRQDRWATARLRTAETLAGEADVPEIRAWCFETDAWRALTSGDHSRAVRLSQVAQGLAPVGSSVAIQATAQEGRARARLGQVDETYAAIDRVQRLASGLVTPVRPEHHYRYDPAKAIAYSATTLAWLRDPAAEGFAREVIARLSPSPDSARWPRRVAMATLDLALVLVSQDRLDEACAVALDALRSGRVVPSNHWRAWEVVTAVRARGLPEADLLRDAYQAMIVDR
jgi:hypothetical protein